MYPHLHLFGFRKTVESDPITLLIPPDDRAKETGEASQNANTMVLHLVD